MTDGDSPSGGTDEALAERAQRAEIERLEAVKRAEASYARDQASRFRRTAAVAAGLTGLLAAVSSGLSYVASLTQVTETSLLPLLVGFGAMLAGAVGTMIVFEVLRGPDGARRNQQDIHREAIAKAFVTAMRRSQAIPPSEGASDGRSRA